MEITRKTQNKITELLLSKDISEKDAMELSNQICDLLEGETYQVTSSLKQVPNMPGGTVYLVDNQVGTSKVEPVVEKTKLIPGTKMKNGYVNDQGKFIACDMSRMGGVTGLNGKPDYELMGMI